MQARLLRRGISLSTVAALLGCSLVYDTSSLTSGTGGDGAANASGAGAGGSSGAGSSSGGTSRGGTSSAGTTSAGTSSGGSSSAGSVGTAGSSNNGGTLSGDGGDGGDGGDTGANCTGTYYLDSDGDGYGDDGATTDCETSGYVSTGGDCDDGEAYVHPGLDEYCDGLDNDCNAATTEVCPLDCEWDEDSGHLYLHCWTITPWPTASEICADNAMRLARVDDKDEQDYLFAWHTPEHAWAGGTDGGDEGVWQWEDGDVFWDNGTAMLYSGWAETEPNDLGANEDCLMLNGDWNHWNDNTCSYSFGFVCERY